MDLCRGELVVYQADDFDTGTSRTTYALRDALGGEQPLLFDSDPKLQPGTPLKVWGNATTGDTLRVTSFRRMPPPDATLQSALVGAAPFAARSFAFVIVDTGGGLTQVRWDGTMHDVTTDFLMGRLVNDDDSLRNYYLGDSYQMQDITAKVIGPLQYTVSGCDTSAMATALRPMVDAQGGPFHALPLVLRQQECGLHVERPGVRRDAAIAAAKHLVQPVRRLRRADPGAGPQLRHAALVVARLRYRGDGGRPQRLHDQRIRRSARPHGRRLPAHERLAEVVPGLAHRAATACRVQSSGTFTLLPFEMACDGAQFLQIKAPKPRQFMRPAAGGGSATTENLDYYYLEARTPVDFDGTLGNSRALTPQVLVHMAADLRGRTDRGLHTFLLDMTPSTSSFGDAALPVGVPFTDPAGGLTITVDSVSNAGATITVEYAAAGGAAPTCMDGTTAFAARRGRAWSPAPGPSAQRARRAPAGSGHRVAVAARRRPAWREGRRGDRAGQAGASPLGAAGSSGRRRATVPARRPDGRGLTGGCACEVSGTPAGGGAAWRCCSG